MHKKNEGISPLIFLVQNGLERKHFLGQLFDFSPLLYNSRAVLHAAIAHVLFIAVQVKSVIVTLAFHKFDILVDNGKGLPSVGLGQYILNVFGKVLVLVSIHDDFAILIYGVILAPIGRNFLFKFLRFYDLDNVIDNKSINHSRTGLATLVILFRGKGVDPKQFLDTASALDDVGEILNGFHSINSFLNFCIYYSRSFPICQVVFYHLGNFLFASLPLQSYWWQFFVKCLCREQHLTKIAISFIASESAVCSSSKAGLPIMQAQTASTPVAQDFPLLEMKLFSWQNLSKPFWWVIVWSAIKYRSMNSNSSSRSRQIVLQKSKPLLYAITYLTP